MEDDDENKSSAADPQEQEEEDEELALEGEGEEAEDGFFPFDLVEFIKKLREKPELPPPETEGCGVSVPAKSYKGWKYPTGERLTVATLNSIDALRDRIPLPYGCLPPLALPSWHFLPLEKKIPLVQGPKGLLYYTRALMGQMLHRKTVVYSCKDPWNIERVVGGPYESLHDPHARAYLNGRTVKPLLRDQGLINDQNEVLCSLREFNKFRDYLRTLYTDEIWKLCDSGDALAKCEREQIKAIRYENLGTSGGGARRKDKIERAKRFKADASEFSRRQAEQRDSLSAARLREWQIEKERKTIERMLRNIEVQKRNTARVEELYEIQLQRRRDLMTKTTRKLLETAERAQNDKAMVDAAFNKFLLEWLESKYVFCFESVIQKKQLQEDLAGNMKYKARKRQRRLEKYREMMPRLLAKKKADTERIWGNVRKFAMRWLEKVRAKQKAPKDQKHESSWAGSKNVLDDTLKYLYQESGYEKLDDFILNIMKLKKQIQHQIEMEEAEEAAAASGGGQDMNDEGGGGAEELEVENEG